MKSPSSEQVRLSVVVPCFNEEENIGILLGELVPALEAAAQARWEIILVDDGSRDGTGLKIAEANQRDPRIRGVLLSRNFGHQPALNAGLAYASGDYVGIMDADLQDPVEVLIRMFHRCLGQKMDVCYGVRAKREASLFLRASYRLFYKLMHLMAEHPWPLDAGDFCVMSRRVNQTLLQLPEGIRTLRGLRAWVGFHQGPEPYYRPKREAGKSKYNFLRLLSLAVSSMVDFSSLPLRLASATGMFMGILTLVAGGLFLVNRLFPSFTLLNYWIGINPGITTIILYISVLFSVLFFCLGIIGEYLALLIKEVKRRPTAIVGRVIGRPECGEQHFILGPPSSDTP